MMLSHYSWNTQIQTLWGPRKSVLIREVSCLERCPEILGGEIIQFYCIGTKTKCPD